MVETHNDAEIVLSGRWSSGGLSSPNLAGGSCGWSMGRIVEECPRGSLWRTLRIGSPWEPTIARGQDVFMVWKPCPMSKLGIIL